ncbi:MAG: hypothetical protein EOP14_00955 [Pseudomonas sp.]|nr:MAG: hypothetical protein EOP14_00955 [Pseudomonas sp.]
MSEKPVPSAPKRKRIVSAERTKVPLQSLSFRMPKKEAVELAVLAGDFHLSKSELILKGLRRCMKDGIWHTSTSVSTSASMPGTRDVSPPPDVVIVSQVLMSICMAFEEILAHPKRLPPPLEETQATLADARKMIAQLLKDHGCY